MNHVEEHLVADQSNAPLGRKVESPIAAKPLRVLHLATGNIFGGIETFLLTLARSANLEPLMTPEFAVCFPGRLRDELTATDRPVHDLGPVRISRPWTVWRARRRLRAVLRATRPDRVVVHGTWSRAVFGRVVRKQGIPLVFFVHGPISAASFIDRLAARVPVDAMIANSEYTLRVCEHFFAGVPRSVCRCPVEPISKARLNRNEKRRALGTPATRTVIIQVSRLERWKGHRLLIEALGGLDDATEWELWIVGGSHRPEEKEYLHELQSLAADEGKANRIKFLGHRSDVGDLLGAADVFCQANLSPEPLGLVFVEALYAGLCVVTPNFGGGAEIVSDTCGILTPPGDVTALTAALEKSISNSGFREEAAIAGPARAAELCDPRRQIHRLYEALNLVHSKTLDLNP